MYKYGGFVQCTNYCCLDIGCSPSVVTCAVRRFFGPFGFEKTPGLSCIYCTITRITEMT